MDNHAHPEINKNTAIGEIFHCLPHNTQRIRQVLNNAGLPLSISSSATAITLEASMQTIGKSEGDIETLLQKLHAIGEEKTNPNTISISDEAAAHLKVLLKKEGKTKWAVKFCDEQGTCGEGYEYVLDFCAQPEADDEIFFSHGIEIYVSKGSLKRLLGSRIDFEECSSDDLFKGLLKKGFTITNPNVKAPCSCACNKGQEY